MANEKKVEVLVIELTDRQNSDFVLEGSEEQGMPQVLDGPGARRILSTSHMIKLENGVEKWIPIRYIKGCSTIIQSEQDEKGIKPNPNNDMIWITACREALSRREPNVAKFDYLRACMYNADAPNRPADYKPIFKEIKQQEVAKRELDSLLLEADAMDVVRLLAVKQKGGDYKYDTDRINYLCQLFGFTEQVSQEEQVRSLVFSAKADPKLFLQTIHSKTQEIRVEILQARQMSVISLDGESASFVQNGHAFLDLVEEDDSDRIEELIRYFLSPEGERDYKQFYLLYQAAKENMI